MTFVSLRMLRAGARAAAAAVLAGLAALCLAAPAGAVEQNFVIGDQSAEVGAPVTFWGAKWWKLNSLSGGTAPAAFKGFANDVLGTPECGGTWTTAPGNHSDPPAAPLAPFVEAIIAGHVTKSGRVISGDVEGIALVATELGYEPDPGHAGTGVVVGIVCRAGESEGGSFT